MKIYSPLMVLVVLCATPALAHEEQHPTPEPGVEQAAPGTPEATVDAFHHAIAAGDGDTALGYLAEDIVIFEEGGAEMSREEYKSHRS